MLWPPARKPALAGHPGLSFNTSHSAGTAVIAVAAGTDVGVDIERIRPIDDAERLAADRFAASEADQLRSLPAEDREIGFLRLWTRKEAVVKALGLGLSMPLDRFSVLDRAGRVDVGDLSRSYRVETIDLLPGYATAAATIGPLAEMRVIPPISPAFLSTVHGPAGSARPTPSPAYLGSSR